MMDNNNSATDKIDMDASRDKQTKLPIEELEALADEWEDFIGKSWDDYSSGVNDATQSCAQELRELIDEYE